MIVRTAADVDTIAGNLGRSAFRDGKSMETNPFSWRRDGMKRQEWFDGWFYERDRPARKTNNAE